MAHLKTANAMVTHPRISGRGWDGVRRVASAGASDKNLSDQAREILGGSLDPDKYLFSHCTIVASVDVEKVPGVKLGKVKVGSATVNRPYSDYHIKPASSSYVNNNGDSWGRQVLLASYPTFIGGQNFQEHVQIAEKSKGRIIDAVARDIGESVYIDILVATSLKHTGLITDIKSKKMGTLSMGCTTDFTLCSQCGHFAVDETDLCEHVRYSKLNTFIDDNNVKRVVAELCGHADYHDNDDAPCGVRFIEASWVAVPAFTGAVLRNILEAGDTSASESEIRRILSAPTPSWSTSAISKAASLSEDAPTRFAFDFGDGEKEGEGEEAPAEKEAPPPFKDLEDSVYNLVKDRVKQRLQTEMSQKEVEKALAPSTAPNDTLNKEARQLQAQTMQRYATALKTLVQVAASDAALVEAIYTTNVAYGVRCSVAPYRSALKAGGISTYASPLQYAQKCAKIAGRAFTPAELRVVVRVGALLSQWEANQ